jgi:hypothetical protein
MDVVAFVIKFRLIQGEIQQLPKFVGQFQPIYLQFYRQELFVCFCRLCRLSMFVVRRSTVGPTSVLRR